MTSSVFGFPDFKHLVELQDGGILRWYGGMISKEPGAWSIVYGDADDGENPKDLYIEFSQPLPEQYKEAFIVTGATCFWRGRLEVISLKQQKVRIEGGLVISEKDEGTKFVREGVWTAADVDQDGIDEQRKRAREALNRALMTPKAETSGFKTPARIAGLKSRSKKVIGPSRDDEDAKLLTDD